MGLTDFLSKAIPVVGPLVGKFLGAKDERGFITDREDIQFDRNYQMQKEFAQNGIRWRVDDAKAAGLHPLAAIGAQTYNASPISVGGAGGNYRSAYSDMGQDFSSILKMLLDLVGNNGAPPSKLPAGVEGQVTANVLGQSNPSGQQPMSSLGVSSGTNAWESRKWDKDGYVWEVIEENIGDALDADWFNKFKLGIIRGGQWLRNLIVTLGPRNAQWIKMCMRLQKRRKSLYESSYPGHGYEFRYDVTRDQFKRVPQSGYPKLFLQTYLENAYRQTLGDKP